MTARDRNVLVIVAVLAALVGSFLLVIQPKRSQASKLKSQISTAQSQLDTARAQVAAAEAAKSSYSNYYSEVARLGEAVPADDNVPSLIYQLQSAANQTGVDFGSLVLGSSSSSSSPTGALSAMQLPPGATVGPANLPIEPFTFTFSGNFFHLADFFGRVDKFVVATANQIKVSGRLMSLNAITLGPGPKGFPQVAASISATTYLVPASEGLTAGANPLGPAASTAQPVSSGKSGASSSSPAATAAVTAPIK
jgi:type II secretory pathway pseudopilin PulG